MSLGPGHPPAQLASPHPSRSSPSWSLDDAVRLPCPEKGGTPGRASSQAVGAQDNVFANCSFLRNVLIWKYISDYPEESSNCTEHYQESGVPTPQEGCPPFRDSHDHL